jgi:hypothetical protein
MTSVKEGPFEGQALAARFGASISHGIWFLAGLQLTVMLIALVLWRGFGQVEAAARLFRYQGALFITVFGLVEYLLSLICWRLFERGDLLRVAWLLISLASGVRAAGLVITNVLTGFRPLADPPGNAGSTTNLATVMGDLGRTISNPLTATLLCLGLLVVLRVYRRAGLLGRPALGDVIPLTIVACFLAVQTWLILSRMMQGGAGAAQWPGAGGYFMALLVGILLVEAILLHRAVRSMEAGLIGRCWGAYVAAVLLTAFGGVGLWAIGRGYAGEQYSYLNSLIWFMTSLSYALGPAHQIEAIMRARCAASQR